MGGRVWGGVFCQDWAYSKKLRIKKPLVVKYFQLRFLKPLPSRGILCIRSSRARERASWECPIEKVKTVVASSCPKGPPNGVSCQPCGPPPQKKTKTKTYLDTPGRRADRREPTEIFPFPKTSSTIGDGDLDSRPGLGYSRGLKGELDRPLACGVGIPSRSPMRGLVSIGGEGGGGRSSVCCCEHPDMLIFPRTGRIAAVLIRLYPRKTAISLRTPLIVHGKHQGGLGHPPATPQGEPTHLPPSCARP